MKSSKPVELNLYKVTLPVITYVIAKDQEQALDTADKLWKNDGLISQFSMPCVWNQDSSDAYISDIPDNEFIEGIAYIPEGYVEIPYEIGTCRVFETYEIDSHEQVKLEQKLEELLSEVDKVKNRLKEIIK